MEVNVKKEFKAELTIKFESIEEAKVLKTWLLLNNEDIDESEAIKEFPEYKGFVTGENNNNIIAPIFDKLHRLIENN